VSAHGWIKFEKDLRTDPRVLRIAREINRRFALYPKDAAHEPCNAYALPAVTLVLGALAQLWSLADSHAENDVLRMSTEELDDYLGIAGFCALLPDDWLIALDDGSVELPGFQEHNGPEAKKRALTQNRVARHRERNASPLQGSNAHALPDKTRQDKTRDKTHTHSAGVGQNSGKESEARQEITAAAALAVPLRKAGVQVTSMHPLCIAWAQEGFTAEQAMQAVAVARQNIEEPEPIPAKYLDKILRKPPRPSERRNGKAHASTPAAPRAKSPIELTNEALEQAVRAGKSDAEIMRELAGQGVDLGWIRIKREECAA
jgi:hypothetical protein